jgi:hypothetical protein
MCAARPGSTLFRRPARRNSRCGCQLQAGSSRGTGLGSFRRRPAARPVNLASPVGPIGQTGKRAAVRLPGGHDGTKHAGGRPAAMRLAGMGLLAAAVAVALHITGRSTRSTLRSACSGASTWPRSRLRRCWPPWRSAWPRCRCCWPSGFTGSRRWRAARVRCRWRTGLRISGCSLLPCRPRSTA